MKRVTFTLTDAEEQAVRNLWNNFGGHAILKVLPRSLVTALSKLQEAIFEE